MRTRLCQACRSSRPLRTHLADMKRLAPLFLAAVLSSGCIGDQSQAVTFTNAEDFGITVYPYGRDRAQITRQLPARAEYRDNYPLSDTNEDRVVARVEATDAAGSLIFCHRYTYGELKRLGGIILVRAGRNDCG